MQRVILMFVALAPLYLGDAGKCCYHPDCQGCNSPGSYCDKSESDCVDNCHGHWCPNSPTPGPRPPPPGPKPNCKNSITIGALSIEIDGEPTWTTVIADPKHNRVTTDGTGVTLSHNTGAYLASGCHTKHTPDMYYELNPLGKTISWTADVHQADCGCNAAFYMTAMPGYYANGTADPSKRGDYYCDANKVGGNWCPEMDLQEANRYALQTTPHECYSQTGKHWDSCDKGGCGVNTDKHAPHTFGPSLSINTLKPYRTSVYFGESNGELTHVDITISQNNQSIRMNPGCNSQYLQKFGTQVKSMVFIMSYWGETMPWLDDPPCSKSAKCDNNTKITFSNIVVS